VVYGDSVAPLVARLRAQDGGDGRPLVVRPANLEDVFLAATGTSLAGEA
jgi:hypothetical protein